MFVLGLVQSSLKSDINETEFVLEKNNNKKVLLLTALLNHTLLEILRSIVL